MVRYKNSVAPATLVAFISLSGCISLAMVLPSIWQGPPQDRWLFVTAILICMSLLLSSVGIYRRARWGRNLLSAILHLLIAALLLLFGGAALVSDEFPSEQALNLVPILFLPACLLLAMLVYLHSKSFDVSLVKEPPLQPTKQLIAEKWSRKSRLIALTIGLYTITWVFGVPAALTEETKITVLTNKYIALSSERLSKDLNYPQFRAYAAFPVLPGIVLVRQDGQAANLEGYGAWALYCWYGVGTKRIASYQLWRS